MTSSQNKKNTPLLQLTDMSVVIKNNQRTLVEDVSLTLHSGETLALVGESGAGKSLTAFAIAHLLPDSMTITGEIHFEGVRLDQQDNRYLQNLRGDKIGFVFQEPMTALNPLHRVGDQVAEVLIRHLGLKRQNARTEVIKLFEEVELPEPEQLFTRLPHQLSGGQRQRVVIAMAIACKPRLLIADEPTTALDVSLQHQIMNLLIRIQNKYGMALLFISHDLGLVRRYCQRACVMANKKIVEQGDTETLFTQPQHAVTRNLICSEPSGRPSPLLVKPERCLELEDFSVFYQPARRSWFRSTEQAKPTVQQLDLNIRAGETLGLVGESGSGKTTLGMALLKLLRTEGAYQFCGHPLHDCNEKQFRPYRKEIQLVLQDPFGSLNPRLTIRDIIEEGLVLHTDLTREQRQQLIRQTLEDVGFGEHQGCLEALLNRYPHEFSGGQRQRFALARALVLKPKLIIMDEPTSSLDRSLQQQLIELLRQLQHRYQIAYLFISHDLSVVRCLSHRLAVIQHGHIVETGDTEQVLTNPQHPYTQQMVSVAFPESPP
ncbi:ABC transporter ATP-binding protein [Parendozoicomonas haliclonae]|uniref:Glutathione import ATP-binding protein GsiA n=1 Tax=Parendozoicomonas haliclonae TaxID=1960125 RepID=A0A1X7AMH8_9GAMM|nr:dipeptide ABC transporter ATP-binding protein [Parendozoicomonas haliclonae]SMA49145.1 Glutathione import ATP-binding protein GsiA [Parendozoicomonas haliclonae]